MGTGISPGNSSSLLSSAIGITIRSTGGLFITDNSTFNLVRTTLTPDYTTTANNFFTYSVTGSSGAISGIAIIPGTSSAYLCDQGPGAGTSPKIFMVDLAKSTNQTIFLTGAAGSSIGNPQAIAADRNSNIYVTSRNGGVWRCTPAGTATNILVGGSFDSGNMDNLAFDPSFTNLYIATQMSIYKYNIVTTTFSLFAGSGTGASGYTDAIGNSARFNTITGLTVGTNTMYVADQANNRIRTVNLTTSNVTTLAGSATQGSVDGAGTSAQFVYLEAISLGSSGILYVLDGASVGAPQYTTFKLRTITPSGTVTSLPGTFGYNYILSSFVLTPSDTLLYYPTGTGINVLSIKSLIQTVAGTGSGGSVNGQGTSASFQNPQSIAYSSYTSNLYVADYGNNVIRTIDLNSNTSNFPLSVTTLGNPQTISLYSNSLYTVLNSGTTSAIARIPLTTYPTTTFTFSNVIANTYQEVQYTNGIQTYLDGPLATAGLNFTGNSTGSICVDSSTNNIYVYDPLNYRIRRITPEGIVSTVAGNGTVGNTNNTIGSSASFRFVRGLAVNSTGTMLYAADTLTNTIDTILRTINLLPGSNYAVSTLGTYTSLYDGTYGFCIDPTDTFLYLTSYGTSTIYKIKTSDGTSSNIVLPTFAATGCCINSTGTTLYFARIAVPDGIYTMNLATGVIRSTPIVGGGGASATQDGFGSNIYSPYPSNTIRYLTIDTEEKYLYFSSESGAIRSVELTSGNYGVVTISSPFSPTMFTTVHRAFGPLVWHPYERCIYSINPTRNRIMRIINTPKTVQIQNTTGKTITIVACNVTGESAVNTTVSNSNIGSIGISDVKTLYSTSGITYSLL
jgi:hypothetical protein